MEIEILNQEKMDNYNFTKGKWIVSSDFYIWADNTKIADCTNNNQATIYRIKKKKEMKANALLISKAPEILEKLIKCIYILDVKCTDGCVNKTWIDFQNGNGEDIGIEIDRFIKESKQLIKEATEL